MSPSLPTTDQGQPCNVHTDKRFQPPTSLYNVFGMYGTLWNRTWELCYWHEVVQSGGYTHLGLPSRSVWDSLAFVKCIYFVSFMLVSSLSPGFQAKWPGEDLQTLCRKPPSFGSTRGSTSSLRLLPHSRVCRHSSSLAAGTSNPLSPGRGSTPALRQPGAHSCVAIVQAPSWHHADFAPLLTISMVCTFPRISNLATFGGC